MKKATKYKLFYKSQSEFKIQPENEKQNFFEEHSLQHSFIHPVQLYPGSQQEIFRRGGQIPRGGLNFFLIHFLFLRGIQIFFSYKFQTQGESEPLPGYTPAYTASSVRSFILSSINNAFFRFSSFFEGEINFFPSLPLYYTLFT